jgi:hypothetical protein
VLVTKQWMVELQVQQQLTESPLLVRLLFKPHLVSEPLLQSNYQVASQQLLSIYR